jgi:cyanophycin synthetase
LIIGVVSDGSARDLSSEIHPSTLRLILNLADKLNAGLLVADIVTPEPGLPLDQTGGAVVDLDVAPELDRFLPTGSELHARAMTGFLRWLYPEGTRSRIPLVAITGTNGKTTTCRMVANIMQAGGFHTGLACTDGIYIEGKLVESGDRSGSAGHHIVFESRNVNLGILETARGALAHSGIMFDWCNVSICLNVTKDHLGEYGVDTIDQMADLKRTVLEAARNAVVLNADDELCIGMLPFLSTPGICLVSIKSGVEKLAHIPGGATVFSVLEDIGGSDWLVLYDNGRRMPVIEAAQIPATYGGLATFNISNALHAIAACYLMGMDLETVKSGIRNFNMSFENTPGRLNFYDKHPFRVVMDFAHNTGSFGELCAFVNRLKISGRKLLMFQVRGDIEDKFITEIASVPAGYFDHYVCRTHPVYTGLDEEKVLALVKDALLDSGVADDQITTTTDPVFAVETMLQMGRKGDLLVFAPGSGQREDTWNQILHFEASQDIDI